MFLHDFSFRPPEEVQDEIRSGKGHDEAAEAEMSQPAGHDMGSGMAMNGMSEMSGMSMPGMTGMQMDLNDFDFDGYLVNDRTLSDPEVVRVEKGGRVLLQIINAAAATVFWIDSGEVPGS